MATDQESLRIIATWLTKLSGITNAKEDNRLDASTVDDLARMLGKEFPSGAFTTDSRQAVAANHPWFPAYADLRASVEKWWSANRPRARQISGPDAVGTLRGMDAEWFSFYHKRMSEIEAGHAEDAKGVTIDAFSGRGDAVAARRNLGSLMRKMSPAAWRVISGSDGGRVVPTEADLDAVSTSVQETLRVLASHRDGMPKSASFAEQMAAIRAAPPLKGKPLGALTPEQIRHARETQLGAR